MKEHIKEVIVVEGKMIPMFYRVILIVIRSKQAETVQTLWYWKESKKLKE